jgi:hypothetical protein
MNHYPRLFGVEPKTISETQGLLPAMISQLVKRGANACGNRRVVRMG